MQYSFDETDKQKIVVDLTKKPRRQQTKPALETSQEGSKDQTQKQGIDSKPWSIREEASEARTLCKLCKSTIPGS
jgi:hypothetical protein